MGERSELQKFLSDGVRNIIRNALKAAYKNPAAGLFFVRMGWVFRQSEKKRATYLEKENLHVPPFLISSIASDCNLYCKGCYARANSICGTTQKKELTTERWKTLFEEAVDLGVNFNLLAGGEPLLRKDIICAASQVKNMIFPIFTNGTLFNEEYLRLFSRSRNLIPVLSMEGTSAQTDERRGKGVFLKLKQTMEQLNKRNVFYGISFTVTSSNKNEVTNSSHINELYSMGCRLIFFIEYVPTDRQTAHLALSDNEIKEMALAIEALHKQYPRIIFISFPGDEEQLGGCLAAGRGFFHINPEGQAEPCPFSPYSDSNAADVGLKTALKSPFFKKLRDAGLVGGEHTGGCVLFEKEELVKQLVQQGG
jgi:MoaA/NifB/PqqE/SkfB family radical SAM enzyme